ncbi:hypothetical protein BX600DRAFT_506540 [Xylariales sp. PMI_506]|nr:hypothetical protein BX600DRAFT_506540 [Xylariales sp. PMI_506]
MQPQLEGDVSATHVTASAPHSALVADGQAISSPSAAASRDTFPSASAGGAPKNLSPKMLFADLYKSSKSPLSMLRRQSQPLPQDFDADLVSKDKTKQKEAVKKYLTSKVRNDWDFKWPPVAKASPSDSRLNQASDSATVPDSVEPPQVSVDISSPNADVDPAPAADRQQDSVAQEAATTIEEVGEDDDDDAASTYSTVSEDLAHWRPRLEWTSDLSDDDFNLTSPSAYRFDTPDAVGPTVQATALAKRADRRRAIRKEEAWNPGLACFNARREAWTGAKTARVKPKVVSTPVSPAPSRRMSLFRFTSPTSPTHPLSPTLPLSPTSTRQSGDTTAALSSDSESREAPSKLDSSTYPVETLLPLAPPILPPANPMRASITPAAYASIYDRIVVHSMTPSCPINLSDVLRSCVSGWKRDGEWPPRPAEMSMPVVAVRKKKLDSGAAKGHASRPSASRRLSLGFLGRRESSATADAAAAHDDAGKGIKKSLQRVLGLGHDKTPSSVSNAEAAVVG